MAKNAAEKIGVSKIPIKSRDKKLSDPLLLSVSEIFHSIQGESTRSGYPTVFIRLAGCNLRCAYCDTDYAWEQTSGAMMPVEEVVRKASSYRCGLVEITGGEPMAQNETPELCEKLLSARFKVMIETNGTFDISTLPSETVKILDIKCPGSGESGKFNHKNLTNMSGNDEIKFVVSHKDDFDWAIKEIEKNGLLSICPINISPAGGKASLEETAKWILESGKNLRLNLQLHKLIWGDKRGV
jgi:7-carboxy-7-deazaguanine synthase